jgi:hypothetical protein
VQVQKLIRNQQEGEMNQPILECASFDLPPDIKAHRARVNRTPIRVWTLMMIQCPKWAIPHSSIDFLDFIHAGGYPR